MFEQATLSSAPASKRLWTTCIGLAGQAALVSLAFLAPMLWPQILPRATFATILLPPGAPPPAPAAGTSVRPRGTTRATTQFKDHALVAPAAIPATPAIIEDPPPESQGPGVPGGVPGAPRDGVPGGILDSILAAGGPPVVPPRAVEPPRAVAATPTPPQIPRVPQGGLVRPARILHRVEPPYPQTARQMRVSGVVELEGVIGIDGHMRELRILSGHPLLAHAAFEAVRQWIYEPTTLNGKPVEVIAPITVTFRLN